MRWIGVRMWRWLDRWLHGPLRQPPTPQERIEAAIEALPRNSRVRAKIERAMRRKER